MIYSDDCSSTKDALDESGCIETHVFVRGANWASDVSSSAAGSGMPQKAVA